MSQAALSGLANELLNQVFRNCELPTLLSVSLVSKSLHNSFAAELNFWHEWRELRITPDYRGDIAVRRDQLKSGISHRDCDCGSKHPFPVLYKLLRQQSPAKCVKSLHYGLCCVDEERYATGLTHPRVPVASDFLGQAGNRTTQNQHYFSQATFDSVWEQLVRLHEEKTSITAITISLLPRLKSLTLWSERRWGSQYLVPFEASLHRLLKDGQLQTLLFPSFSDMIIGCGGAYTRQAIDTFNFMAIFATLPTVKGLRGSGVQTIGRYHNHYRWASIP